MTLREKTIKFNIGNKTIGGSNDILIQTMANIKTSKVEEILALDKELKALGNDLLRLSVLDEEDAEAFKELSSKTSTPLIADIHFDYRLAIKAIQNGAKKIRINPGNIGGEENLKKVIDVAKEYNVPIRIGVNSGSLSSKYTNKHDELDSYMESLDVAFFRPLSFWKYHNCMPSFYLMLTIIFQPVNSVTNTGEFCIIKQQSN